jgi:hypothetical protein
VFAIETPQPNPTKVPIELFLGTDLNGYILLAWSLAVCLLLITSIIMVRALIAVSDAPAPSMLVVALSLLTLLAIFGGVVTQNDESWTIAAAGVGALAGSVTALFDRYKKNDDKEKGDDDEAGV